MDVEVYPHTTIWDTKGGVTARAIPKRRTEALRIILDPGIKPAELPVLATAANAYPRVRVILGKGSSVAWSHLRYFKSLVGVAASGIDDDTSTKLREIPESVDELYLVVVQHPDRVVDLLRRFTALKKLSFTGKVDGIAGIVALRGLRELHLYCASKIDMQSLQKLSGLRHLIIHHGSIVRPPKSNTLPKLEVLDIWKTRGIESVEWIGGITSLRDLQLGALPRVAAIPDLRHHRHLERVVLDQMKGLTKVGGFARAPRLRTLHIQGMNQIPLEEYEAFRGHPTLSETSSGFSSKKKDAHVNQLLGLPRVQYEPVQNTKEF